MSVPQLKARHHHKDKDKEAEEEEAEKEDANEEFKKFVNQAKKKELGIKSEFDKLIGLEGSNSDDSIDRRVEESKQTPMSPRKSITSPNQIVRQGNKFTMSKGDSATPASPEKNDSIIESEHS